MKDSDDGGAEMLTLIILTTNLCISQILKTNHKEGQKISNKSSAKMRMDVGFLILV